MTRVLAKGQPRKEGGGGVVSKVDEAYKTMHKQQEQWVLRVFLELSEFYKKRRKEREEKQVPINIASRPNESARSRLDGSPKSSQPQVLIPKTI